MKFAKLLTVLIGFLLFNGCIKEDRSDCPRENVFLTLVYTGNTTGDNADYTWFNKMIDRVSLYVYNADTGEFLPDVTQQLEKAALTATNPATAKLMLPEGRYTIVCWGNAFDATTITPADPFANGGTVNHPNFGGANLLPTQDHNYYGTTTVTVPKYGHVDGEIRFVGSHINMEIIVKGFTNEATTTDYPRIEVANAMPQYGMTTMAEAAAYSQTYLPVVGWSAAEKGNRSVFQLFQFHDKNPLTLTIKNQSQERTFYTASLETLMKDNGITVEDAGGKVMNEASVKIILDFTDYWKDLAVKVTVEGWSVQYPIPEL